VVHFAFPVFLAYYAYGCVLGSWLYVPSHTPLLSESWCHTFILAFSCSS